MAESDFNELYKIIEREKDYLAPLSSIENILNQNYYVRKCDDRRVLEILDQTLEFYNISWENFNTIDYLLIDSQSFNFQKEIAFSRLQIIKLYYQGKENETIETIKKNNKIINHLCFPTWYSSSYGNRQYNYQIINDILKLYLSNIEIKNLNSYINFEGITKTDFIILCNQKLLEKVNELENKVVELTYRPDGPGFEEAKNHFEKLIK